MLCQTCTIREKCVQLCEAVEKHLKDNGIYKANYIRKRNENPVANDKLERIAADRAFEARHGKRKLPPRMSE